MLHAPPDETGATATAARPWLPTLLVGALAVLALGGTAWLNPFEAALGSAESEAPGHLFGLWATAQNLFETGPLVRVAEVGFPATFQAHLMDPINLLLFLPLYWLGGGGALGATLGWNAVHAGWIAIGAWGCWRLARRVVGPVPALPWASALLTAVFCMSPFMLYVPFMGRTEYLPALLYPLHLSLLHEWLRAPVGMEGGERGPPPSWRVGLLAGLTLGAIALGGWYIAVFAALAEIPFSLWLSRRLGLWEAAWRLALVAGLGLLVSTPAAWALYYFPPDKGNLLANVGMEVTPQTFPSDALPVLLRAPLSLDPGRWMDQPPYVGVGALLLGIVAALTRPRLAIWPLLTFWLLSLALGPFLLWTPPGHGEQDATPFTGYYLLELAPALKAMRSWSRVAVLAALPAGMSAALGYALLTRRMEPPRARLLALGALALLLLDQASWPVRWSPVRPWFDPAPPAAMLKALEALPEGALLELPVDLPLRTGGGPEARGQYLLWHLVHGRPVSTSPKSFYDGTLASSALTRLAVHRQILSVAVRGGSLDPAAPASRAVPRMKDEEIHCAREDAGRLREAGFAAVLLHRDRAGSSELDELLRDVLGDPVFDEAPVQAWDLALAPAVEGDPGCELPSLPEHVARKVDRPAPR